jgi:hypothetical protein
VPNVLRVNSLEAKGSFCEIVGARVGSPLGPLAGPAGCTRATVCCWADSHGRGSAGPLRARKPRTAGPLAFSFFKAIWLVRSNLDPELILLIQNKIMWRSKNSETNFVRTLKSWPSR